MLNDNSYRRYSWGKLHRLVLNRVSCANQIFGCRFDFSPLNPLLLSSEGAEYRVTFGGVVLASWRAYDLSSVESALDVMDGFNVVLWRISRAGYLRRM